MIAASCRILIFSLLFPLLSLFNSLYAEYSENEIQKGLVYFAPPIFIPEKTLPCQGFRLSGNGILTSPACYIKVLSLLDQQVEALNEEGNVIGRVVRRTENRCDSESLSNYFSLERYSENSPHKDFSFFTDDVAHNTEAAVNYLIFNDESAVSVNRIFEINPNTENESPTYLLPEDDLPDGAVVEVKGKPLCIVSGTRCLGDRAFKRINYSENDSNCDQSLISDIAGISHFFDCRDSMISDCCLYYGSLNVYGTCVNPCSHQRCPFYIEVVSNKYGDVNEYCGGDVYVNCTDCYSDFYYSSYGAYPNCGLSDFPNQGREDCKPKGCIPGCKSTPGKDDCGNNLIAPIAGGIAGGVVLIGTVATIATVIGCLVYKHKRRSGYRDL